MKKSSRADYKERKEDQGDPQVEALADAVHAAVGEKGVGLRQDGQLVYLGKDLDIGRNISQLFRPAPTAQRENGPYPLPAPQGLQAGAIKGAAAVVCQATILEEGR